MGVMGFHDLQSGCALMVGIAINNRAAAIGHDDQSSMFDDHLCAPTVEAGKCPI